MFLTNSYLYILQATLSASEKKRKLFYLDSYLVWFHNVVSMYFQCNSYLFWGGLGAPRFATVDFQDLQASGVKGSSPLHYAVIHGITTLFCKVGLISCCMKRIS